MAEDKSAMESAAPQTVEFEGNIYALVKGEELFQMLNYKGVRYRGTHFSELFDKNNEYIFSGTRAPVRGKFVIGPDAVCIHYYDREKTIRCKRLYRSENNYLMVKINGDQRLSFSIVDIEEVK